ncbi:sugar ABC transporter ATP-binding protein [Oceanispirochaeta crateris]|uniref:Ribose/galactose/methyl galactoside import ATP-binding protein n=1 Tax=Oceanispirochaeta crateris TaxID=2518645 RepID=A0A5C1QN47_9SPIO|nr:sugar ABC transporter ATP-binding protein [Oceanispirochaeta crateris]QEN09525.1 sugar ABC transporter ATP-binding protein [Oceanispirochaeta crateris]
MSEQQEYILEMHNITKSFPGVKALDNVSLKVRPGTVHALMGENGAGKSTLMKCLFGIYKKDDGEVFLNGEKVEFHSAKNALESGVSMIHQELSNVPERYVMENLWLGREPLHRIGPLALVDHKKMYNDTLELMKKLEMVVDPRNKMSELSISKQQGCEIAKAVSYKASVVVMDEPSSSLSETEVELLFKIINNLKKQGVAIIYISHKMSEIFQISDEISVMRDGRLVASQPASELDDDKLIKLMVGRDMTHRFPPIDFSSGDDTILKVENLTASNPRSFKNISFELKKGEILGIGGLVGAQRTELVEAIFGLRGIESGTIEVHGKEVVINSPREAIANGIGLITEDRRGSGIFPLLSILDNTSIPSLDTYIQKNHLLNHKLIESDSIQVNKQLRTKTPTYKTPIQNLSGGNQQKVIVARWLMTSPDILIMDEPTRGIDVGAKYEIYLIMTELIKQGKSIIMVSSEMPELLGMSSRVMVLCNGKHTGTLNRDEANQESIMRLAAQFR